MPGLINAHTHIAMSLMRHYADDLPFWEWLNDRIIPLEERLTPEDVHVGSLLSIAEMIRSGITTFADMYFLWTESRKQSTCRVFVRICHGDLCLMMMEI